MPSASHSDTSRTDPISRRVAGFIQHLRRNGFVVGPAETVTALATLEKTDLVDRDLVRLSLKTLLANRHEEWVRFDDMFEAYWSRRGRERASALPADDHGRKRGRPDIWADHLPKAEPAAGRSSAGEGNGHAVPGRLGASCTTSLATTDLRSIADAREIAEAERVAYRLARALVYRLSRRFRLDKAGARLDLRRTIRRSIPHGGEPIDLARKTRPDRPVRIVLMLDVSGSMKPYSRFYLQFMKGLLAQWKDADAYLFHTRLVRVTDAVREHDPSTAMTRLSLLAEGFGGGTRIGESLKVFNDRYARRTLNSRSVFIVLSDGYDTGPPDLLVRELARLKRRARRLVWLNPLLGWRDYAPVTRAMIAALPFLDHFAAAHTLETLAAIESDLRRL